MDLSAAQQHQLHHHYLNHQQQQHQQQQEMDAQSLDSLIACSKQSMDSHHHRSTTQQEKNSNSNPNLKPRPADNEAQKCPRCDSNNTKFCYYNNYSLSQPRYFCKACRRYWTKGGTLRNVPVGGGCRKSTSSHHNINKRPSSPNSSFLLKRAHHTHDPDDVTPTPPPPPPSFYSTALTDCDGLLPNPQAFGFLDSLRHGNGGLFQSLCYGAAKAVSAPFDDVAAGVGGRGNYAVLKQENEGRAFWGFPWQVNSSYGESFAAAAADVEPNNLRGSWNGLIGNSAWQGLLNSAALI